MLYILHFFIMIYNLSKKSCPFVCHEYSKKICTKPNFMPFSILGSKDSKVLRIRIKKNFLRNRYIKYFLPKTKKEGSFYEAELQAVTVDPDALWRVDAILKTRGKGEKKEVFVHWHGWPKKYDQWLPAGHLV